MIVAIIVASSLQYNKHLVFPWHVLYYCQTKNGIKFEIGAI
jgi:hypothetical protein